MGPPRQLSIHCLINNHRDKCQNLCHEGLDLQSLALTLLLAHQIMLAIHGAISTRWPWFFDTNNWHPRPTVSHATSAGAPAESKTFPDRLEKSEADFFGSSEADLPL